MVKFVEAIKRPFQDAKKLVIGIVLSIIPIVNLIALGYVLENTKSVMKKSYKLTEWKNWGDLFVKGLLFAVISLIYIIPALVVFLLALGNVFFASLMGGVTSPMSILANLPAVGIGMFVFIILALLASYVIPAATLNYIVKNKFSAAFDFAEIKKRAFKGEYLVAWLIGGVYSLVLAAIFMWIPIVGASLATFITSMTTYTMIAEAYASK
jgi:hypothetical protein